jgi:hypothetical protein
MICISPDRFLSKSATDWIHPVYIGIDLHLTCITSAGGGDC